jgi:LacI family transcriptional regulator
VETEPSQSNSTIYDVAKLAGVSIATVSRVLNGHSHLKDSTRALVLQSVKELQFVPNNAARGLSSGSKRVIGLLFVRTKSEDFLEIVQESLLFTDSVIRGAERAASDQGYSLLLGGVESERQAETIDRMISMCDGLVLLDRTLSEREIPLIARRVPTILLAGNGKARSAYTVRVDNGEAMQRLARHLVLDHGLTRLAFLSGFATSPDSQARREGFVRGALECGASVEDDQLWFSDYTSSGAVEVIERRVATGAPLPQAIACANDQAAIGAMHALKRAGFRVPSDVAITGFDDISVARHVSPTLTTVHQPVQQLGTTAVQVLLQALQTPRRTTPLSTVLPTTLMLRQSCGCTQ